MLDSLILATSVVGMVGLTLLGGRWVGRDDAARAARSQGYATVGWFPGRSDEARLREARAELERARGDA